MKNNNIDLVGDLVRLSESDVINIRNIGHTTLVELEEALAAMDCYIGMNLPVDWKNE